MAESPPTNNATAPIIEIVIKLSVLALLIGWCILILKPFISPLVWGVIMAVAAYPLYSRLRSRLGGHPRLAAAIMTIVALLIIILPGIKLAGSMIDGIQSVNEKFQSDTLQVPMPPEGVKDWPVIGVPVEKVWRQASVNLTATLDQVRPQLIALGRWLVSVSLNTGVGLLSFALSIIIAGVLMGTAEGGARVARNLFVRLAGRRGAEFADDATVTVRNVVKGILGVAIIQALLAGIGFAVAGVPAAGLWTFLCLLLAIVQIGIGPIAIPIMIYMFYKADILTAVVLAVWLVMVLLSDNVLKPILLGRGAPVPMPVIFLGAIGGFMSMGFLGLFVGAIVLSIGYKLFESWLPPGEEAALTRADGTDNTDTGE
jgi:predicted PurR-regulated permease PerM